MGAKVKGPEAAFRAFEATVPDRLSVIGDLMCPRRNAHWSAAMLRPISPIMTDTMFYVAIGACVVVLLVLLFGVLTFARGGEFNRKYSNKIMRLRLAAQAIAVALILLAVWLGRQGG